MRRKRLNHVAFTLCHMFCGWRLVTCYRKVAELGSGTLIIDVPSAKCNFNAKKIPSLTIAHELQFWFRQDLADNNIPAEEVLSAIVTAQLELNIIESKERKTTSQFFSPDDGRCIKSPKMYQCKIDCESKIVTSETEYKGKFADVEEWPEGF